MHVERACLNRQHALSTWKRTFSNVEVVIFRERLVVEHWTADGEVRG